METHFLDQLSKRGRDFLGVRYPYICGAMTWVNDPKLVAAVSDAEGIATGRMCAHLFLMGAAGVQMGTLLPLPMKAALIRADARDAASITQFDSRLPVVAVRALRNRATDDFGKFQLNLILKLDPGQIGRTQTQREVEELWMGRLRSAVIDGDYPTAP